MKKFYSFLYFLLCIIKWSSGQSDVQIIKGLSTKEAYDLLLDKRGFLWVAHELGISRMNWNNLDHFSNPSQASLSMAGLLEDEQDRIWCYNFNGQVFYVENNQMKLLGAYDNTRKVNFPSMVLCNGYLVITSQKGLMVCHTSDLKCYDIDLKLNKDAHNITALKDKVILYDGKNWFAWQGGRSVEMLEAAAGMTNMGAYKLQQVVYKDTMFLVDNRNGTLEKIILDQNKIKEVGKYTFNEFINGVTIDKGQVWVHTKTRSITIAGSAQCIPDCNLTDIVTDHAGNIWYTGLNMGVGVRYNGQDWEKVYTNQRAGGDVIRTINALNGELICGTQHGNILIANESFKNVQVKAHIPMAAGGIEFMKLLNGKVYIGTSLSNYSFDIHSNLLHKNPLYSIKDVDSFANNMLVASSAAFYISPLNLSDTSSWLRNISSQYPYINSDPNDGIKLMIGKTCKSVRYERLEHKMAIAFSDGLVEADKSGIQPVLFNHLPVYANSMDYAPGKLYISTPGNGLLIKDRSGIRNLTLENGGLLSNNLIHIKAVGQHLWILEDHYIQVLDMRNDLIESRIELPEIGGGEIYDITELSGNVFIASKEGVMKVPLVPSSNINPNCYIDNVKLNDGKTITENQILPYFENNIQFTLSSSWYSLFSNATLKYRLIGADDKWQTLQSNDGMIRYASLMPGDYTLQAYTEVNNSRKSKTVTFHFIINKPWWHQWWFYAICIISFLLIIYSIYRYRVEQVLKVDLLRRKLSADLHDDLGATLSSVNIYAELAKEEEDNEDYLRMIQLHSNDVIRKLRDLVWSINPKNDSYEQLLTRMNTFAGPYLQAAGIQFSFDYDQKILRLPINLQIRQNLYLIFKELVNNVVRHSQAGYCSVHLRYQQKLLVMEVSDNGTGFDCDRSSRKGNGLENIRDRVCEMHGKVYVQSASGMTSIRIEIPS